mgnify:FL=1
MTDSYILALVTAPSFETAEGIAHKLVEQKLAACVNILPGVRSIYAWKGEIHTDEESLLLIKTRVALFSEKLAPAIKAIHPYEVPEIIALPIEMGAADYLDWIGQETQPA